MEMFDAFRKNYHRVTFEAREFLSLMWNDMYPKQECFNLENFIQMFGMIDDTLSVVELGCHNGKMAKEILRRFHNIRKWHGYDFNTFIGNENGRYRFVPLETWFHDTELKDFNVFVCSHTLEHMSNEQAYKTLRHVMGVEYVLLEVPHGDWHKRNNSHVLDWSKETLKEAMHDFGYEMFFESSDTTGWKCLSVGDV